MTSKLPQLRSRQPERAPEPSFPTRTRAPALIGGLLAILAFGGLAAWSALAPLSTAVTGQATLIVDGNRKAVQHLEGGIVQEIFIADGEAVEAGDPLVRLVSSDVEASVQMLQGRIDEARGAEARLVAEQQGLAEIAFPAEMLSRAGTGNGVAGILDGQRRLFASRRTSMRGEASILEQRIEQIRAQVVGIEHQRDSYQSYLAVVNDEVAKLSTLAAKGHAPGAKVRQAQKERAQLLANMGEVEADLGRLEQQITETKLQIVQTRTTFLEKVEDELRKTRAEIFDLNEQLTTARNRQARLTIASPVSGRVVDLKVYTVGGVISPGDTLMEIVPTHDRLVVEARIAPSDIENVQVGLPVDIRLLGLNQGTTPVLSGEVSMVSADRLVDPRTQVPYFLTHVTVADAAAASPSRLVPELKPGMPATVIIRSGERTLFGYLVGPMIESMALALLE